MWAIFRSTVHVLFTQLCDLLGAVSFPLGINFSLLFYAGPLNLQQNERYVLPSQCKHHYLRKIVLKFSSSKNKTMGKKSSIHSFSTSSGTIFPAPSVVMHNTRRIAVQILVRIIPTQQKTFILHEVGTILGRHVATVRLSPKVAERNASSKADH